MKRFFAGTIGSDFGFFLSKPGVDVLTASGDDLLISPALKNMSYLILGKVDFTGVQSVTVNYGVTLTSDPLILPSIIYNSVSLVPGLQWFGRTPMNLTLPERYKITPGLSSAVFASLINNTFSLKFMVIGQAVS